MKNENRKWKNEKKKKKTLLVKLVQCSKVTNNIKRILFFFIKQVLNAVGYVFWIWVNV